jgi:hypothetical protein
MKTPLKLNKYSYSYSISESSSSLLNISTTKRLYFITLKCNISSTTDFKDKNNKMDSSEVFTNVDSNSIAIPANSDNVISKEYKASQDAESRGVSPSDSIRNNSIEEVSETGHSRPSDDPSLFGDGADAPHKQRPSASSLSLKAQSDVVNNSNNLLATAREDTDIKPGILSSNESSNPINTVSVPDRFLTETAFNTLGIFIEEDSPHTIFSSIYRTECELKHLNIVPDSDLNHLKDPSNVKIIKSLASTIANMQRL